MFKICPNPKGKLFLQDGDPSQNSCKARSAWDKIRARKFSIPARSPDLNPIKNIFHILKKKLHKAALEMKVERKDFQEFSARVKTTLESVYNLMYIINFELCSTCFRFSFLYS